MRAQCARVALLLHRLVLRRRGTARNAISAPAVLALVGCQNPPVNSLIHRFSSNDVLGSTMLSMYLARRQRVLEAMGKGVLVLFAAPSTLRNNDVEHEYRQDSDFHYLTGLDEPECALVLTAGSDQPFVLFVRERDPERETWDGERIGVDGALEQFCANTAHAIQDLPKRLLELLKGQQRLFYAVGCHGKHDQIVIQTLQSLRGRVRRGETYPTEIIESSVLLHEMRQIKSDAEIGRLRRAIEITEQAHHAVISRARPGMGENELDAILRERFRALGSERCAYPPIVASARNGRILHHRRNDRMIGSGELVLVDAGAEFGYMAADVTRTFPSSGTFSPIQRRAYDIVLRAQECAIRAVRPGKTLDDVHAAAVKELCSGLIELGILSGTSETAVESESYKKYYMHQTSHWLGMDVHDVGTYFKDGAPRLLAPGMVLTVEPGLYFAAEDEAVPEGLKDVGIRIEDDILVTATGCENLSAAIVKNAVDIERMMSRNNQA